MAQNSVPVFLNGKQTRAKPNMRAWRMRPNPVRRDNMRPSACVTYTGQEAQQKVREH